MTDVLGGSARHVLELFGEGIVGEPVVLVDADGAWPFALSMPERSAAVLVPTEIDGKRAQRAVVLHQLGFVEHGTFDVTPGEVGIGASPRLRAVFAALEHARIDASTRRRYPGARVALDRLLAVATDALVPSGDPLVDAVRRFALGDVGGAPTDVLEVLSDAATVRDSARVALGLCADRSPWTDAVDERFVNLIDEEEDGVAEPSDEMGRAGMDFGPEPTEGVDGDGSHPGRPLPDTMTTEPGLLDEQLVPAEPDVPIEPTGASSLRRSAADDGGRVFLYDEWDHHHARHLPAWCRLVERRLVGDDFTFIGDVRRRHATLAARLRRQFAFVRPEGWVRVHRADDGDELDLDAVIEAVVDRRAGRVTDDRLHVRRDRAARDVATALLVDLSASTSSPIPPDPADLPPPATAEESEEIHYRFTAAPDMYDSGPPAEPERRVIDIAKDALALMCDALEQLGDRHAVYGFSGQGRDDVEFVVAKDFQDRTSATTWAALAAMQPRRYTRMGPAIRHAAMKLSAQQVRTKLLIVVSDGYPQDIDYGPNRADKEYGLQDTARALQDAAAAGIASYCVTIDPAGHDYLRRMCADQHYLVIDDVAALPRELAKLYASQGTRQGARPSSTLRTASAQRRFTDARDRPSHPADSWVATP